MSESTGHNPSSEEVPDTSGLQELIDDFKRNKKIPGLLSTGEEAAAALESLLPALLNYISQNSSPERGLKLQEAVRRGDVQIIKDQVFALNNHQRDRLPKRSSGRVPDWVGVNGTVWKALDGYSRLKRQVPRGITQNMQGSNLNPSRAGK